MTDGIDVDQFNAAVPLSDRTCLLFAEAFPGVAAFLRIEGGEKEAIV